MQRRLPVCLLVLALSLAVISCPDNGGGTPPPEPGSSGGDGGSAKVDVRFINGSAYAVNVFVNAHRELGGSVLLTVPASGSATAQLAPSQSSGGDSFYFEYVIPVGEVEFPYFSFKNSKVYVVEHGKANAVTIDALASCPTKSAYLLLENATTASLSLLNGTTVLTPQAQESRYIAGGASGVFLLGQNGEDIYFKNTGLLKVSTGTTEFPLPDIDFELGNIYTVTVTTGGTALKSIAPFDIDTQKQIWSFANSTFLSNASTRPVLRERRSGGGCLIAGTLRQDATSVGVQGLDWYGAGGTVSSARFDTSGPDGTLLSSYLLDFAEQGDGSIVMLLQNTIRASDGTESTAMLLVCYNFDKAELLWSATLADSLLFRSDTRNKLLCVKDGVFAVAGAILRSDGMHPYFACIDVTGGATQYIAPECADFAGSGAESMFTSAYYDGTDFYVCGYDNCDFTYTARTHTGIIYRLSGIGSGTVNAERLCAEEACLFFGMDGQGEDWFVCGEYAANGGILKGCYLSSAMVAVGESPVQHTLGTGYCWFSQLCCSADKIILCGKNSKDSGGSDAQVFVAAYSAAGRLLWENASFQSCTDALSLIPNAIGTYIIQLATATDSTVRYVSADLLGNEK